MFFGARFSTSCPLYCAQPRWNAPLIPQPSIPPPPEPQYFGLEAPPNNPDGQSAHVGNACEAWTAGDRRWLAGKRWRLMGGGDDWTAAGA